MVLDLALTLRLGYVLLVTGCILTIAELTRWRGYLFLLSFLYGCCGYKGYLFDLSTALLPEVTLMSFPFFVRAVLIFIHLMMTIYWVHEVILVFADWWYRFAPQRWKIASKEPSHDCLFRVIIIMCMGRYIDYKITDLEHRGLLNFDMPVVLKQINPNSPRLNQNTLTITPPVEHFGIQ